MMTHLNSKTYSIGAFLCLIFALLLSSTPVSAETTATKKAVPAIQKVVAKKKIVKKPIYRISSEVTKEQTFAQFYASLTTKQKSCVSNSLGSKKIATYVANPRATLSSSEVTKMGRCVGHFIPI